jgi:hypothetical protein
MKSLPNRREAPSAADSAKDKWDWPTRDQLKNFWTDQLTDKDNLLWELDSIRDGVLHAPMPLHYAQPWVDRATSAKSPGCNVSWVAIMMVRERRRRASSCR